MTVPSITALRESATARVSLVIVAVIMTCAALYWLRDILTPLMLAFFLVVMVDAFSRVLKRRFPTLPSGLSMMIAVVASIGLFGGAVWIIAENGASFAARISSYGPQVNGLIARVAGVAGVAVPPTIDQLLQNLNPTRYVAPVAQVLQGVVEHAVFVLIYVGFLIASRHGLERKIVRLFPARDDRHDAVEIYTRIRDGIESYLWIQTVTGLMIAAASYILMAILGVENAFFWAFLIFVAGYIPIIGGAIGIALPPIFALVQFPTLWQAGVLLGVLWTVNFIVGNVILPKMQSDSMDIDPIIVLLSLGFWGALWGVPGAFMSTPLTVMVMVICAQFEGSRWIAILLSQTGDPARLRDPPHPSETMEPKAAT